VGQGAGSREYRDVTAERAWTRATFIALWTVGALLLVITITGIVLTFRYRPATSDVHANAVHVSNGGTPVARDLHRWSAWLLFPAGVVLGVAAFGLFIVRRRWIALSLPLFGGLLTVIAFFTGLLLPWDQLALYAVTVGSDIRGYTQILHGDTVKYVIVGNVEISRDALRGWFWTHVGTTLAIIVVVTLTAVFARPRGSEEALGSEVGAEPERAQLLPHD
jgi:quinol-cytochrome oxidoreductase complex cytochrome b subunit